MIELLPGDFQPVETFPLRWRWTDAKWNLLSADELEKIRPLTASKAKLLHEAWLPLVGGGESFSGRDRFSQIDDFDAASATPDAVRHWLERLPVRRAESVVVSWDEETAVSTEWQTFSTYWDDFCYPMQADVLVLPLDERWGVFYFHEERLSFGIRRS